MRYGDKKTELHWLWQTSYCHATSKLCGRLVDLSCGPEHIDKFTIALFLYCHKFHSRFTTKYFAVIISKLTSMPCLIHITFCLTIRGSRRSVVPPHPWLLWCGPDLAWHFPLNRHIKCLKWHNKFSTSSLAFIKFDNCPYLPPVLTKVEHFVIFANFWVLAWTEVSPTDPKFLNQKRTNSIDNCHCQIRTNFGTNIIQLLTRALLNAAFWSTLVGATIADILLSSKSYPQILNPASNIDSSVR